MFCIDGMIHYTEQKRSLAASFPVLMQIGNQVCCVAADAMPQTSKTNLLSHHISDDIED